MTDKTSVGVLYGGRSAEHDVSCASGLAVLRALDPNRFCASAIGISRDGAFWLAPDDVVREAVCREPSGLSAIADALDVTGCFVRLVPGEIPGTAAVMPVDGSVPVVLDVVFPVLHGPFGEDGTLQGLLEMIGVPYVGSGVLPSAVGMDKVAMKRALRGEGIAQVSYVWRTEAAWRRRPDMAEVISELGLPLFVKPANLGSSVGVTKVTSTAELGGAVAEAMRYDHVVVIEAAVVGRELECGVLDCLGGLGPQASVPGEIVVPDGFYDFSAKYMEDRAKTIVPADIPDDVKLRVQQNAIAAFQAIGACGLARVDFFWDPDNDSLLVNEVNTMPGFTSISMFPKMWEASGVPYAMQIERLCELAFERHALGRRRGGSAQAFSRGGLSDR